jgi:hypothetical protein
LHNVINADAISFTPASIQTLLRRKKSAATKALFASTPEHCLPWQNLTQQKHHRAAFCNGPAYLYGAETP